MQRTPFVNSFIPLHFIHLRTSILLPQKKRGAVLKDKLLVILYNAKKKDTLLGVFSVLALPIFPGRLQPSIVGRSELNFRVRDGNGWTLALISTNYEVYCTFKTEQCIKESGRLIACINCRSSPRAISTGQLHTLLHFHLRPINQIVFLGPYSIKDERSHLRGSFTLRCFQRLSRPYIATQPCPWQDNWCTRGMSIPVLSY